MLNKCIYTRKIYPEATFKKKEHIFPAGIGGIKTLDNGVVCDEINEFFSKLEMTFMRESIVSIPRMFIGPGKRGRGINSKQQTKSKVSIFENKNNNIDLGYTSLGKPFIIPQIKIDCSNGFENINSNIEICFPPVENNLEKNIKSFICKLDSKKFTVIKSNKIKKNVFIVGYENKIYIASNPEADFSGFTEVFYEKLVKKLQNILIENLDTNVEESHITTTVELQFNIDDYFRICSKIAFNALAYLKGKDYVLNSTFDEIRNFIVNGGDNKFIEFQEQNKIKEITKVLNLKNQSHFCIFLIQNGEVNATLSLYGMFHRIKLTPVSLKIIQSPLEIDGFFCNWEDKKEKTFSEFY